MEIESAIIMLLICSGLPAIPAIFLISACKLQSKISQREETYNFEKAEIID